VENTIESCFRLSGAGALTGTGRPPPVIVKFRNPTFRLAALRAKRLGMPPPTPAEKDMGIEKFTMAEDLTPATFKKFKELQADTRTGKIWTTDGKIRFTTSGDKDSKKIYTVKSVFDSVDTILVFASEPVIILALRSAVSLYYH
jgi:hypothetical protein